MKNDQIEKIDFSNWPLPDNYLIEIGRITAQWASLESFLNLCIGKLAGFDEIFDPKPFILVNHSSIPQKLDILSSLCELLESKFPNLQGYQETISKLKAAQKQRNIFLHNGMSLNPETGRIEMSRGASRGKLKTSIKPINIADIRRAVMAIDEAQISLYNLVLKANLEPVWKKKMEEQKNAKSNCLCCQEEISFKRPRQCPICKHQFKGNGWDGIDAHWRAKHNDLMTYEEFWNSLCECHRD